MSKKNKDNRRKYFCDVLQKERACKLITQEEFAKRLGMTQEQVSKLENGKMKIDVIQMIDICVVLGVTLMEFAAKIEGRFYAEGVWSYPKGRVER